MNERRPRVSRHPAGQGAEQLRRENKALRERLEEAEATIRALRAGEVDAVVIGADAEHVYTLETADTPYRLLVEQIPHAAATLTNDGAIIYCNSRFADLLRQPARSLVGRAIHEFVAVESRATLDELLRDCESSEARGEVVLARDAGGPTAAYLGISCVREGALGHCLLVTDLTEQQRYEQLQRAQAALRASEEKFRTLFESIDEGFCVIEVLFDEAGTPTDYRFLEVNPSFEHQTGLRDAVGRRMREMAPSHEDHWFEIYGRVAVTGEPIRFQNRAAALHRWYDVYAFRIGDPGERKVAVLFNDISDRKRTEDALKEADRRKDEFLATLAHELRNPLAPIRNATAILNAHGPDNPELRWARGVIDRQVRVMGRLLEDLLDVSRISRTRLDLRLERVDLKTIVEAALETSRPLIEAGGHELTVSLPRAPIDLRADPVRLAQVFANLLNNAAKYTDHGGHIWLTAERQGDHVTVCVKDTGIGMTAEMLPHIFEIFSQARPAGGRAPGGLGIGLSLIKGLVELHGGSVTARSEGLGRGSEFVVRLPVPPDGSRQPTAPGTADQSRAPAVRRRVLVADDNRDSADSLAELLQIMGNDVTTTYDGDAAVASVAQSRPEVVLLDIGMSKLDGFETCRRIREQPGGEAVWLIALTGWGQEDDRRRTREAGFDYHLIKPADPDALMQLLSSLPAKGSRSER